MPLSMSVTRDLIPHTVKGSARSPSVLAISGVYLRWLVLAVLLDVVEAQRKDFDDYLKEDFRPIFFFVFSFHFQS